MAVIWQTGEPPCGETLIMQYEFMGRTHTRVARCRDGKNGVLKWQELPSCHIIGQPATRWSTLDAAPDALGRLEAFVTELHGNDDFRWVSLFWDGDDRYVVEAEGHDRGNGDDYLIKHAEATSLAAAIEQLL